MSKKTKEAGFEATLAELEALVSRMETGELPLEQALGHFERGVQLTREAQQQLQQAQQRVQLLLQQNGAATLVPFAADAGDADR